MQRSNNTAAVSSGSVEVIDPTLDDSPVKKKPRTTKGKTSPGAPTPEKRARVFRKRPPKSFLERRHRAITQRMCVMNHTVTYVDGAPEIAFDIAGSVGNVYKTVIGKIPYCTCPDNQKGNHCKHICYVLINALRAPEHLQYQLAFLSEELRQMYEESPLSKENAEPEESTDGNRKPVEGDCPICFMEFDPEKEEIVWCRARCGNNIHKTCFEQWARTQRAQGVRCVYCRSPWEDEKAALDMQSLLHNACIGEEGYINVADQLGLSRHRDYSTYSPWLQYRRSSSYYGRGGWY